MFLHSDLDELLSMEGNPAVSLYLPTHVAGREMRQDRVRLRNLVHQASELLTRRHRRPDVEGLLAPAHGLINDEGIWAHPEQGLAVFLVPGRSRVLVMPSSLQNSSTAPKACGSVRSVGVTTQVAPLNRSARADSTPRFSLPAMG